MMARHTGRVSLAGALGTILALSLTMVVPGVSQGADVSFTDSIPVTNTDWATPPAPPDPLVFPQFDPALGELQSVTLTLVGTVDGEFAVENTSTSQNSTATLNLAAAISVDSLDPGVGALAVLPTNSQTANLDVFDGTIDFGGPSGATFPDLTATGTTAATLTDVATLALYTGTGTVTLPATAQARSNFTGGGNIVGQFTTNAGVDVTVEYTFDSNPAIDIQKTPDLQTIPSGLDATFTITVTNTGALDLVNVAVTDPIAPDCDNAIGALAIGASATYDCTLTTVTAPVNNVATVNGETVQGTPVSDEDDADVEILLPAIDLVKTVNTDSATAGDVVTYSYVVTNIGDVTLTNVTLIDDKVGPITLAATTLDPGESTTGTGLYTVTEADVASPPLVNVADVTGTAPDGSLVTDQDTAEVPTLVLQQAATTTTTSPTTTMPPAAVTLPPTGPQSDLAPISAVGIGLLALGGLLVAAARRPAGAARAAIKEK